MADDTDNASSGNSEPKLKVRRIDQEEPLAFFRFNQTPLSEVIEDLPDGYYEVNLRGDLIAFNRALCRIHGYPPETMVNMNYRDYTPSELHDIIFQTYTEVYNTGRPVQVLDFQVTRPDGSICIIHTSIHLVRDKDGKPRGFRGISRDVTEQKRNEAYEQARTRVLENIARNAPMEETLEAVLTALQAQMPDFAGMFLVEEDGRLRCAARVRIPDPFVSFINGKPVDPDGTISCRAAFQREAVIVECVETDPRCASYRKELAACGIKAIWAHPVLGRDGDLLGVLSVYPRSARGPQDRENDWLQSATATAEIAITHHRVTSELSYLSWYDNLTGILNRRSFMIESERLFALASRKGWTPAILFLDLDRFKQVNDTWGHQIGDLMLKETAGRLSGCLRQSDCIARLGGDEFAIFVPETDRDSARTIANRILRAMAEPFDLKGVLVSVGISIGIALAPRKPKISVETLLVRADEAMYQAKTQGLGWAFHKPEHHRAAREEAKMESLLRRAMAMGDLLVHYQPVLDLEKGQWVGAEALVRWNHPERGVIRAAEFLPLAESRGLIREIDRYVLPRVLEETRNWNGWISVNVSPLNLGQPDWVSFVRDCLEAHEIEPERLVLEVTERVLLDMERVRSVLEALCRMGVRIALDDFGSGYSSLSYLANLSVHCLKMGQGFIRELNAGSRNTTLVRMLLALTEKLGVAAVAEGVETKKDLDWLAKNGCRLAQGFYLARPAAWEDLRL